VTFIDREVELRELRALPARNSAKVAVLYGRRRVGKTRLLQEAWKQRRLFYFLAADQAPEINRRELLDELSAWSGRTFEPADYPTWRTVMRLLVDLARRKPMVVVLDEFQYLCRGEDDIRSQATAVLDKEAAGVGLTITACGSAISFMQDISRGSLFGRKDWSHKLEPFDYWNAARMLPGRTPRDLACFYGVFGGIPRYLADVKSSWSLKEAAVNLMLSPRGPVHQQLRELIEQERAIREPGEYNSVLEAIGRGKVLVSEIVDRTKQDPTSVRAILSRLEHDLELIYRERNYGASKTTAFQHRIADPALAFWHRFVLPMRSRLELDQGEEVWDHHIAPYLDAYMGKVVFERMCWQAYVRLHQRWGLAGCELWSRWEGLDRNRRSIEIDMVGRLDTGGLLTGEIKYQRDPVGPSVHADLLRDLEDLGNSGRGWAKDGLKPSARMLYFSASGFSADWRKIQAADPRISLKSIDDLYAR
jgi:AAA+ ATPase superfamily predicted ATPase